MKLALRRFGQEVCEICVPQLRVDRCGGVLEALSGILFFGTPICYPDHVRWCLLVYFDEFSTAAHTWSWVLTNLFG